MIVPRTTHIAVLAALAIVCLIGSTVLTRAQRRTQTRQAEPWRKRAPESEAPRPFKLPATQQVRLDNGLEIVFIEDHRAPVVTMMVGIPIYSTSARDLAALTNEMALIEATAELITEGAGSKSSEQIAREVETLGGRLSSSANDDYAWVTISVIAENTERMMELLGEVLMHPSYPESEVGLYKRNRIQKVVVERQDPSFLAGEQFDRIVYGTHPYAISAPTPSSIDALNRDKIISLHKSEFTPRGSVIVIAGDLDATRTERKVREVLGKWQNTEKPAARFFSNELPNPTSARIFLMDRPGSAQADFRIGGLAIKRSDDDYFPLVVANAILGAGTNSRLFLNIREKKGYAYDVFSSIDALRQAGTFFGGAETRTEVTVAAIKEMLAEFDKLRTGEVGSVELQDAKNYINGLFSLSLSTQGGVAERVLQTYMFELGRDYLETYRSHIESVTAEDVRRVAGKYLVPNRATTVVVGDASRLKRELNSIGAVTVVGNSN